MRRHRIPDGFPLLAEILRESGYHTYAAPTRPLAPILRLTRGFDEYNARKSSVDPFIGEWGDGFIARFKNREFKEPWFVYLHLFEVHQPRHVLPRYNRPEYGETRYDRAISGVDVRLGELIQEVGDNTLVFVTADHGEKIPESKLEVGIERQKNRSKRFLKRVVPKIAGPIIANTTKLWFRATRLLRRAGLLKSSLATLTGHGYHVYDCLVRVPFIVAGPGVAFLDRVVDEQVRQIDILPTILDLAGLADRIPFDTIDGRSLVPLLRGEKLESLPAFIESWVPKKELAPFYGVRTANWKYAYSPGTSQRDEELYDLSADPEETSNLAAPRPDVIAEMRGLADGHFQAQPSQETGSELTREEQVILAEHLRGLGYIE